MLSAAMCSRSAIRRKINQSSFAYSQTEWNQGGKNFCTYGLPRSVKSPAHRLCSLATTLHNGQMSCTSIASNRSTRTSGTSPGFSMPTSIRRHLHIRYLYVTMGMIRLHYQHPPGRQRCPLKAMQLSRIGLAYLAVYLQAPPHRNRCQQNENSPRHGVHGVKYPQIVGPNQGCVHLTGFGRQRPVKAEVSGVAAASSNASHFLLKAAHIPGRRQHTLG
jgi:hypothetical protein